VPANASSGRESTFGRAMMNYVNSYLPYQSYTAIDTLSKLNPKFKTFQDTGSKRTEALSRQSISSSSEFNDLSPTAFFNIDSNFTQYMYANVQADKIARLRDYRVMGAFSEVAEALDEICDEAINKDDNGEIARLEFPNENLKSEAREELREEFEKIINYFEFEKRGWEYFRSVLVDGELYWENIIHREKEEAGVLGVVSIPTELVDPIFGNVQNMLVKGYLLRKPVFDKTNPSKVVDYALIPMDKNQVTYVNSGIWNENKTIRLPFIENARRAYRQLSLIEDSIVIYRLARAPERLVFNVDVGTMPAPKAEAYLRKMIQDYWSKRTFDMDQSGQVNKFNPQSYLDNYWFARRQGSEGTTVTQIPGGQALNSLPDLDYFLMKLYKALKVPVNRLSPDSVTSDGMQILREELKFAKFIMRIQDQFAESVKNTFIVHLKLKNIWNKFDIKETDFDIKFVPPTNFFEMREAQKLEIKYNAFNNMVQNESVSKTYAQKKYLKWNDQEILANRAFLKKDKELEFELAQITANGPNWRQLIAGGTGEQVEGQPMAAGGGGAIPTGEAPVPTGAGPEGAAETPPAFGPPPAGGAPAQAPAAPAGGTPADFTPETPPA
jgi:hypothetical protein